MDLEGIGFSEDEVCAPPQDHRVPVKRDGADDPAYHVVKAPRTDDPVIEIDATVDPCVEQRPLSLVERGEDSLPNVRIALDGVEHFLIENLAVKRPGYSLGDLSPGDSKSVGQGDNGSELERRRIAWNKVLSPLQVGIDDRMAG